MAPAPVDARLAHLLSRKSARVVTVALANKAARVIWAIMARRDLPRASTRRRKITDNFRATAMDQMSYSGTCMQPIMLERHRVRLD